MQMQFHIIIGLLFARTFVVLSSKESKSEEVTLDFVGDINVGNSLEYFVNKGGTSYNESFAKVAHYLREADVAIGNLESSFLISDAYLKMKVKGMGKFSVYLHANKTSASSLRFAGLDVVTLANNHLNDYGELNVNFTQKTLKEVGLAPIGVNFGPFDAPQVPLIKDVRGIKIGFLAYCDLYTFCTKIRLRYKAGPAIYTTNAATRDVNALKAIGVDILAVFLHWGKNYNLNSVPSQRVVAKHFTSLGVTLVIGSHSHVLQPHCYHDNALVAFGLGNFLFPQYNTYGNKELFYSNNTVQRQQFVNKFLKATQTTENPSKFSHILRVRVTRTGVVSAHYLPLEIKFNVCTKALQPTPQTQWIKVCSKEDEHCVKDDKCL